MRYILAALVLLCGCVSSHKHVSTHIPKPVGKYDMSSCKLQDRFATQDVAVLIVRDCFHAKSTLVVVVFSSEFYDVAAEEAASITIKLLGYKPILTPVFNTYLTSANKKNTRPMIIFAVTGKQK